MEYNRDIYEAIKYEYYKQQKIESAASRPNPQLDQQAAKAAVICEQLECDPATYVAAQLIAQTVSLTRRIFPTCLATDKAIDNVYAYKSVSSRGNTWPGIFAVQKGYLKTCLLNTTRSLEAILNDHNLDFDAWFRCLMSKQKYPAVLKKWGYKASQDLKNPELVAFLEHIQLVEKIELDLSRIPRYQ